MSAEKDARLFLSDVYADKPANSVIAVGSKSKPHYALGPEHALQWVVEQTDAYCRATLLAHRPRTGRGKEADAIALPGLVADLDVNGSPNGRNGVVTGAFDTLGAAIECAHSIVQPTLMVNSGYGLQPWWLLHTMEPLTCDEDRQRVKAVAKAWQQALRDRAGVKKVDGVHDLARLMRAPGSYNGKGTKLVPVVLLDNGGPRYDLSELAAHVPELDASTPSQVDVDVDVDGVDVQVILTRHADLAKLVKREGKAPGDGTPSTWEWALACRAIEHGYDDNEVAALIVHARRAHPDGKGKDERLEYIAGTVGKARAHAGVAPRQRTVEQARAQLANLLRLERAPEARLAVEHTAIYGHGATARALVQLTGDLTLEFDRVGDISKPTRLSEELAASVGVASEFTKLQAIRALALVRQIADCSTQIADYTATDAVATLILQQATEWTFDASNRYDRWRQVQEHDPLKWADRHDAASYARSMIVLRNTETRDVYVRASWAQEVMRRELGPGYSSARVQGLLLRVGWTQPTSRGVIEATRKDEPRVRLWFYVVPNGWGQT